MNCNEEEYENGNLVRYCLECGDGFYANNRNRLYCQIKYGKRDYCKIEVKKKKQKDKRGGEVRTINLLQRSPVRKYILNPTEGMKKFEEILQGKKVLIINVAKLIQHGFTESMVSRTYNLPYRLGTINFVGPYVLVRVSNSEVAILTP